MTSERAGTLMKGLRTTGGFSLLELIVVAGIISVVMVGATVLMPQLVKKARADGSAAVVLNTLRLARDRAISERRNMLVTFSAPQHLDIIREVVGAGSNTTILSVDLDNNMRFLKLPTPDTPDGFGLVNEPTAFGPTAGTLPTVMFTSEGSVVDGGGDPINGTVFLAVPGDPLSSRAVTVFGVTALLRLWRWDGTKWTES